MVTTHIRSFLLFIIGMCIGLNTQAQIETIPIESLDSLMTEKPKPIWILLSTDWCQYCAMQHHQIQKNENFKHKADQFYFIDFNAESKDKIKFQDKQYVYKPTGLNIGTHELAFELNGSAKISYPTWVLLDRNYQPIFRHNGLLNPQQLNELLEATVETFKNN